jgi:iron complex outermembrane recepter protein
VEALTLTAGFNYTHDSKRARSNNSTTDVFSGIDLVQAGALAGVPGPFRTVTCSAATGPACNPFLGLAPLQFLPPFLNFPNAVESGKTSDNDLSYTLRAAYKFSPNVSAYATHATGFKASSFNLSFDSRPFAADFIPGSPFQVPPPATSPIQSAGLALPNLTTGTRFAGPEDATVYEIGLKGSWQGFGINLAFFKQILKGFQSNVFTGTGFVLANAEKQSTKGVEIDATLNLVKNLSVTASYTYLDPIFDKFTGGSAINPATNTTVAADLTGETPSGISKHSVAIGTTYVAPIGDNELIFHADYALNSAFQIAQGLDFKAKPESLNASIAFKSASGFELSIWGRNLSEPKFNPVIFPSVAQAGSLSTYASPPKTYGVSGRLRF